jgi:hypothetical protein
MTAIDHDPSVMWWKWRMPPLHELPAHGPQSHLDGRAARLSRCRRRPRPSDIPARNGRALIASICGPQPSGGRPCTKWDCWGPP